MKWKDIEEGYEFKDGSKVISKHGVYEAECYIVKYYKEDKTFFKDLFAYKNAHEIVLSNTHLLLIDIHKMNRECRRWVEDNFSGYRIPVSYNKHIYFKDLNNVFSESNMISETEFIEKALFSQLEVSESDDSKVDDYHYWLPISAIFLLVENFKQKLYCNGYRIKSLKFKGYLDVFCVETDTHRFEMNGLIHHNSVTLRNIILHCLTHQDEIAIALVDLKWVEFSYYKGFKNVVAVANTIPEACEILRLAKEVMYKRNQEMSKLGINNIADFKPQQPTGEVMVAGRKLKDEDLVEIKTVNGEIKTVTVKELEGYLQ